MAISTEEKLEIYRRNLSRYQAEGDAEKCEIQQRLIERIEREASSKKGGK